MESVLERLHSLGSAQTVLVAMLVCVVPAAHSLRAPAPARPTALIRRYSSSVAQLEPARAPPPARAPVGPLRAGARFVDEHFLSVGIVGAIALAACAPELARRGGPLGPERFTGYLDMLIFFIGGLRMRPRRMAAAAVRVRMHAAIQGFSFGAFPLVVLALSRALALAGALALDGATARGLLTLSAMPTTINTHVQLTRAGGGDEALAIFNGIFGNLIGVVITPLLLLALVGRRGVVPFGTAARGVVSKLVLPLVAGQCAQALPFVAAAAAKHKKKLSRASDACLLFIVLVAFSDTFARDFAASPAALLRVLLSVACVHAAMLATAWSATTALAPRDRVAFLMTATHKTLGRGLPIIRILFADRDDLSSICTPLLLHHPVQLGVGLLLSGRLAGYVAQTDSKRKDEAVQTVG